MNKLFEVNSTANKTDWETPKWLFQALDARYHFTLDVCAEAHNAKCRQFYSPADDGLTQPWHDRCWMNPPYGAQIGVWLERAHRAARDREVEFVMCLLPARPGTGWFQRFCPDGQITFLQGRLTFEGAPDPCKFDSCLVMFWSGLPRAYRQVFWWNIKLPFDQRRG